MSKDLEANVRWSALREVFEELFAGEEAPSAARERHDWYLRDVPAMRWFADNEGAYDLELLGCAWNAIAGQYEMSLLLAVHDTRYWDRFHAAFRGSWESQHVELVSTRDRGQVAGAVMQRSWTNESLVHFAHGLRALRALDSRRISLPECELVLGD